MSFFSNITSVFSSIGDQLLPIKSDSDKRIILIGAKNTGKTTLITKNSKIHNTINNSSCNYMELDIKLLIKNERKLVTLQLYDSNGLDLSEIITTFDACIICFALNDPSSLKVAGELLHSLIKLTSKLTVEESLRLYLCGNKADVEMESLGEEGEKVAAQYGIVDVFRISASLSTHVLPMFREISKQLLTFEKTNPKTPPGDMNHNMAFIEAPNIISINDDAFDFGLKDSNLCKHDYDAHNKFDYFHSRLDELESKLGDSIDKDLDWNKIENSFNEWESHILKNSFSLP